MLRRFIATAAVAATLGAAAATAFAQQYLDPFDGNALAKMWTFRNAGNNDRYTVKGGWFTFDVDAGQDLFRQGVDGAPFLLMDPPEDDATFEIETMIDVILDQKVQPPASHAGLIIFAKRRGHTPFGVPTITRTSASKIASAPTIAGATKRSSV